MTTIEETDENIFCEIDEIIEVSEEENGSEIKEEQFKEIIKKFMEIDDEVKEKEKELRNLRNQKKPLETIILNYLEKTGEDVVETTSGKLRLKKSETKTALSEEIIQDAISKKIADPSKIKEIMTEVDTARPKTVKVNLKRSAPAKAGKGAKVGKVGQVAKAAKVAKANKSVAKK